MSLPNPPQLDRRVEESTRRQKAALGLPSEAFAQAGRRAKVQESSLNQRNTSANLKSAISNLQSRSMSPPVCRSLGVGRPPSRGACRAAGVHTPTASRFQMPFEGV
jgi:hypothetical protein